ESGTAQGLYYNGGSMSCLRSPLLLLALLSLPLGGCGRCGPSADASEAAEASKGPEAASATETPATPAPEGVALIAEPGAYGDVQLRLEVRGPSSVALSGALTLERKE